MLTSMNNSNCLVYVLASLQLYVENIFSFSLYIATLKSSAQQVKHLRGGVLKDLLTVVKSLEAPWLLSSGVREEAESTVR